MKFTEKKQYKTMKFLFFRVGGYLTFICQYGTNIYVKRVKKLVSFVEF